MKIKRIEIVGFKSFVDKVSLDFQEGVTAVLGPNGCGKSNIVDAIRWAMGEQNAKNLRGRSMEDVIFGGSETRKPLGMAEVSMIFANEDGLAPPAFKEYAEIMVTRRLYRNGESEYLINKTPCRLKDITELFMDTGVGARAYSIIEQGKIGMILNAKPEERRYLIEEAAGVTKYKSRKKTALRKIEATRHNLQRLGDIVSEVRRQLGGLKRQAQKAERYREYREELKGIEIDFARRRYRQLQSDLAQAEKLEAEQTRLMEGLAGQLEQQGLALEEARLVQAAAEREVAQGQERVFHLTGELQKVEGRIGFGGKEIENLDLQKTRIAAEIEEVKRRLAETDLEETALQASQVDLGSGLEAQIRRLAEGETHLEELASREQEAATQLEAERSALFGLLTDLTRTLATCEEARRRMQSLEERTARNRTEAVRLREQGEQAGGMVDALNVSLEEFRQRREALEQEREELREGIRIYRRSLEQNESELLVKREELSRYRSRLESLRQLEASLEGYGSGVRTVLNDPELVGRFGGMVADALEVPARYEVAVEAVLGDRLQSLLAADGRDALMALESLRQSEGRCGFVLAGFAPAVPESVRGAEAVESLVQLRPGSGELVRPLLSGVYLVESLEPFLAAGPPPGTSLVTEAGDILTSRGEFSGGGRQGSGPGLLHKKREMKELSGLVEGHGTEVEQLQQQRIQQREDLARAEEALREVEAAIHRKELKLVDREKDLVRVRGEAERLQERLEVLSLEEDQLHEEGQLLERQLAEASRGREEKEAEKLDREQAVARLQEEQQILRRQTATVREQVTALKVEVASIREREENSRNSLQRLGRLREELRGRLASLEGRREEAAAEQHRLRAETERLGVELELLFGRREEEKRLLEGLRERFEAGARQIEEREESLKVLRNALNQARDTLAEHQLRGRELGLELEHLRENLLERYRLDLAAEPVGQPLPALDEVVAERRRKELRQLIEAMGEVNLMAIEEYRELEERAQFLIAQQEDLRQSLEGLQAAINKINRTTRKRFRETFDLVNAKFMEIFPRLFRGGQAELKLTDEQDLLETGIEIVAQPPGKKLQSVNLLSGGEKALAAVALIFSIFLIKPSPFCMLDEVDAPLDEANIGRFNGIVKEMSEVSQFIIITHNKRTMEIADILYGVTMEEPGVSKLVSVRIKDF